MRIAGTSIRIDPCECPFDTLRSEPRVGRKKCHNSGERLTLARDVLIQDRNDMLRETDGSPLRGIEAFPILKSRDNAHKRAVSAIHPDGIGYQIELRPVFTRCRTPMRLVPVK